MWKEVGGNPITYFADYDMRFIYEQHSTACPSTFLAAIHEDDPSYHPLPPEKQWTPASCPNYRPPQVPTYTRRTGDIEELIHGIWATRSGAISDECLVLLPDGSGVLEYWNPVLAGCESFCWRLDNHEHLVFGCINVQKNEQSDAIDGATQYFGTHSVYFELLLCINVYGDHQDMLCVYPDSILDEPREFFRSLRSIENYKIPDK
jgi:hypothetical protein